MGTDSQGFNDYYTMDNPEYFVESSPGEVSQTEMRLEKFPPLTEAPLLAYVQNMVIIFPSRHVPLELLWRFAHDFVQLTPGQMTHVTQCDECMSTIGLCTLYE